MSQPGSPYGGNPPPQPPPPGGVWQPPSGPPPGYPAPGGYGQGPPPPDVVAGKIRAPGIALLIANAIGALYALVTVGMGPGTGGMSQDYLEQLNESGADLPPGVINFIQSASSAGYIVNVVTLLLGVFLIWGSVQMMSAKNYGVAMVTAILSMIPCLAPCCVLGLPFGIWALIALSDVNVKALFQQNAITQR